MASPSGLEISLLVIIVKWFVIKNDISIFNECTLHYEEYIHSYVWAIKWHYMLNLQSLLMTNGWK